MDMNNNHINGAVYFSEADLAIINAAGVHPINQQQNLNQNQTRDQEDQTIQTLEYLLNRAKSNRDRPNGQATNYNLQVPGLTDESAATLEKVFDRPISSEGIFLLRAILNSASELEINSVFRLYIMCLDKMSKSNLAKPPEILASLGIYLSIILRYNPNTNLYVNGNHFLLIGLKCYTPYVTMYITSFLMIAVIKQANIESLCFATDDYQYGIPAKSASAPSNLPNNNNISNGNIYTDNKSELRMSPEAAATVEALRRTSPKNSKIFDCEGVRPASSPSLFNNNNNNDRSQAELRARVGTPNDGPFRNNLDSNSQSTPNNRTNGNQLNNGNRSPTNDETVIDKIINTCPIGTVERKLLSDLKRLYKSSPNYFLVRLGLKTQKQEIAIFLDMPELLDSEFNEEDIQKAIFLHSNNVLENDIPFKPHHFNRSIQCLNYNTAKKTSMISDWIHPDIVDEFIFMCREIKHAVCLEMLLLVVRKNITLCKHHMKRIPEEWIPTVLEVYLTPRWRATKKLVDFNSLTNHTVSNNIVKTPNTSPKASKSNIGNGKALPTEPLISTLEYYKINLSSNDNYPKLLNMLDVLSEQLRDEATLNLFIDNLKSMNMSNYIFSVSGYTDFFSEKKIVFFNDKDSMFNNVFEVARNFIVPYREGERVYLFDYNLFPTLIEKRENPYNRNPLSDEIIDEIISKYQMFNNLGLGKSIVSIPDFIKELIYGREVDSSCACRKNYVLKLVRALRHYNIKEESFEFINLSDIVFKFSLISMDFNSTTIPDLCYKLYMAIKIAADKDKEQLKRTIASTVLIYSRINGGGGFIVNI